MSSIFQKLKKIYIILYDQVNALKIISFAVQSSSALNFPFIMDLCFVMLIAHKIAKHCICIRLMQCYIVRWSLWVSFDVLLHASALHSQPDEVYYHLITNDK